MGERVEGRVVIDGVEVWRTVEGDGPPVVLLHGGFSDSGEFDAIADGLAASFRVHRYDRRGHGRTPDVDGPLDPQVFGREAVAFLDDVVGEPAALVGYSDGAAVALAAVLARPDLVTRLVLISCAARADEYVVAPEPGMEFPDVIVDRYAALSPDGRDHFPVVADRMIREFRPGWSDAELTGIGVRSLVMAADDDIVALEHTAAIHRAVPDAELAIVPGTSHALLEEKPAWCLALVEDFLAHDPVPTLLPVRRA